MSTWKPLDFYGQNRFEYACSIAVSLTSPFLLFRTSHAYE